MGRPDPPESARFSIVVGGPFHALLRALGATGPDCLPTRQAAIGLALLAWLPPALLAVAQSLYEPGYGGWSFFSDWTVPTRFLLAVFVMVGTERHAEARILLLTSHFRQTRLLGEDSLPAFDAALEVADRRSSSALAEGVLLALALVWSTVTARFVVELSVSSWEGNLVDGAVLLSWAGQASRLVSNPLFLFLVFRWIWRFLVWTALLFRVSRLPLQLTPLHPDRSAGLGFLSIYPSVFSGFVFALSCVVAASFIKDLEMTQHDPRTVWFALAGWMVASFVLFLGPLLVFVQPLYAARERALLEYGRLASQHHLAFYRKWVAGGPSGEDLMGSTDPSSTADLNATVQAVRDLQLVPVDRAAVLQLALAAGVPLLAVIARQVPLFELLKWIAGTIL